MNLLASYNWIKEYIVTKESAASFAAKLSLSGPGFERLYPQGEAYANMVIGKIVEVKLHPKADRLRIAITDLGKRQAAIVCGGTNLAPDMKVAVALSGAMVRWHGEGEPIRLEPAVIRGVESEGMICAADEIGLGEAFPHASGEILDLSCWCKARPGTTLAKALEMEDTVFDIEVTTNRVDSFSVVGIAREAAAILGTRLDWKEPIMPSVSKTASHLPLTVRNRAEKLCTRYMAAVVENVTVGSSPWWLKKRLIMSGIRPINNVVDITNYVMLEYGQPMHAFDYDKLIGASLQVRKAEAGEKLLALDGRTYEFEAGQMVIADAERPVAVAGVMGGEETGVTGSTRTIVFEAATFDGVHVRRTARALNLHSDSSLRFEKGLPEEQTSAALARAVELCERVVCGRLASEPVDLWPNPNKKVKFAFRPERAEEIIGVRIPRAQMTRILRLLGFVVTKSGTGKRTRYEVTVPYWRVRDIEGERDFAEEIARIYGYHNIPSLIPSGEIPLASADPILRIEEDSRRHLVGAGFTELITYSMIHGDLLRKAGEDSQEAIRIANPLTVDFEFLRLSLRPGVLNIIAANEGLRRSGRVFEIGRAYFRRDNELPVEEPQMLVAVWGEAADDSLFREAKGVLESFLSDRSIVGWRLERLTDDAFWHPGRSARIFVGDDVVGTVGELHPMIAKSFGLDVRVALIELKTDVVVRHVTPGTEYVPVPQFPPVLRDLAIVVPERVEFADVSAEAHASTALLKDVELFDVYRGKGVADGFKSVAMHLTFADPNRTLTAEDVEAAVTEVLEDLKAKFGAERR